MASYPVHPIRRVDPVVGALLRLLEALEEACDVFARCGEVDEWMKTCKVNKSAEAGGHHRTAPQPRARTAGAPLKKQRLMSGLSPALRMDITHSQSSRMPSSSSSWYLKGMETVIKRPTGESTPSEKAGIASQSQARIACFARTLLRRA